MSFDETKLQKQFLSLKAQQVRGAAQKSRARADFAGMRRILGG